MSKIRYYVIAIIGVLMAGAGLYLVRTISMPEGIMKTLPYIMVGLGCGLFGHGTGAVIQKLAFKNHPELTRQMDIDTKDERNIQLGNMAKAKGFDMMTYVFGALMVAFALMGTSLNVIIPFVIAYLFVEIYSVYYRVKYDKQY